ncbi:hypothetical protein [Pseudoalteromonas sp. McH1-42]|uniref:hypothetical protein n=1 Tax=Pseudoalteromonas sp. McH1-42 TaxID=2917752 RepID=UPI001EF6C8E5|nr:hypothetical protein [Pseudoalteromonas sp. McH1-42]MCG7564563.1 hypothetical protein [Pseudoalteromonas sp. McH1-42]
MLKIAPAVYAKKIPSEYGPMDYILYPDSEKEGSYYAMAERPTFQVDENGDPCFNLTWYFGSGETPGGICSMTVALPIPDMNNKEVQSKIIAALTGDQKTQDVAQKTFELCQAMDAEDQDQVTALQKELGFDNDTAKQKYNLYNKTSDWTQFLPKIGNLKISPMPYKSGEVTVQAFANEDAYQKGTPAAESGKLTTIPSSMNSNDAVVTFNLQDLGANLFWHGMGGWSFAEEGVQAPPSDDEAVGGSSIITVSYKVEFDGLLPAAEAVVTLNKEVMAKLDIEDVVKRGSWGRRYREKEVRGKEYIDAINNSTKITIPAVIDEGDTKQDITKLLTDWSAKQLEEMAASQMPNVNMDDLKLGDIEKLKTVNEQKRTYSLAQAVRINKYPQAQLSKISSLLKNPNIHELKKFFNVINLNDKPYFNVNLTVGTPSISRLKELDINSLVVTSLEYHNSKLRDKDGNEVSTISFESSKDQPASKELIGTFSKGGKAKGLRYSYKVIYNGGTDAFEVKDIEQSGDQNYLDLSSLSLGVLNITVKGQDLPWEVLSNVNVEIDGDGWTGSTRLDNNKTTGNIIKHIGKDVKTAPAYKITYNFISGSAVTKTGIVENFENGIGTIMLKSPLGDRVYDVNFELGNEVSKAKLRVEYTVADDKGTDHVFKGKIELDKSGSDSATWKVPAKSDSQSSIFKVIKLQVKTASGQTQEVSDLSGGTVAPVMDDIDITVLDNGLSSF